jgi:hypothetical protein
MAGDLDIFIRHLNLAYHIWPTLPIYIHSASGDSPVEWSASPAQTHIDFVWKINQPYHQDLTQAKLRERQVRLLDPISKLVNHGQNVKILGAEHDLVSSTVRAMTPRLLSLDAVGWNLYHLIKAEKQYLDQIPNHQTPGQTQLSHAYQCIAGLGWLFLDNNESPSTAFVFKADSPGFDEEGVPVAYWSMENGQHDQTSCWQYNVQILSLDCTLTMAKMALDMKGHNSCNLFTHFCRMILQSSYFAFPDEIQSAVCHYECFLSLWQSGHQKRVSAYTDVLSGLNDLLLQGAANGFEDEYVRQDRDRVARIVSVSLSYSHSSSPTHPLIKSSREKSESLTTTNSTSPVFIVASVSGTRRSTSTHPKVPVRSHCPLLCLLAWLPLSPVWPTNVSPVRKTRTRKRMKTRVMTMRLSTAMMVIPMSWRVATRMARTRSSTATRVMTVRMIKSSSVSSTLVILAERAPSRSALRNHQMECEPTLCMFQTGVDLVSACGLWVPYVTK